MTMEIYTNWQARCICVLISYSTLYKKCHIPLLCIEFCTEDKLLSFTQDKCIFTNLVLHESCSYIRTCALQLVGKLFTVFPASTRKRK